MTGSLKKQTLVNYSRSLLIALVPLCGLASARAEAQDPAEAPAPAATTPTVTDSTVQILLETPLETPAEKLRAIIVMIDLDHGFAARGILDELLAANLTEADLSALVREVGTARLMRLSRAADLQPQASEFATAALNAASAVARSPARLAALIEQLASDNTQQQIEAIAELRRADSDAVGPIIAGVSSGALTPRVAVAALVGLEVDAERPLWAALEGPSAVREVAAEALGRIGGEESLGPLLAAAFSAESSPAAREAANEALVQIVGSLPSLTDAAELLRLRARRLYDRPEASRDALSLPISVWRWEGDGIVRHELPPLEAARVWAARLAQAAYEIEPDNSQALQLYLATGLEAEAYLEGLDEPLPDGPLRQAAIEAGPTALLGVLETSLRAEHPVAATVAAQLLAEVGTEELLYRDLPQRSPLVDAARHPYRRLRMAAIETILALDPQRPYAGSNVVPEGLAYFVTGVGSPRVIVADPVLDRAVALSSLLAQAGYEPETVVDGRELFRHAAANADVEFILMHHMTGNPRALDVLADLRRDNRTKQIPVGVITSADNQQGAELLQRRFPLTKVLVTPQTPEDLEFQLNQLRDLVGSRAVSPELRRAQAIRAIGHLAQLGSKKPSLYQLPASTDLIELALYQTELVEDALQFISGIGTPTAQRALVDTASSLSQPIGVRRRAVMALRRSLADFGILLTTTEITRQYERYNASESLDLATQDVLGAVLDAIEQRGAWNQQAQQPEAEPLPVPET